MQVLIRMTEEEKRKLRIFAAENNMSMSDFIRKLLKIYEEKRTDAYGMVPTAPGYNGARGR